MTPSALCVPGEGRCAVAAVRWICRRLVAPTHCLLDLGLERLLDHQPRRLAHDLTRIDLLAAETSSTRLRVASLAGTFFTGRLHVGWIERRLDKMAS